MASHSCQMEACRADGVGMAWCMNSYTRVHWARMAQAQITLTIVLFNCNTIECHQFYVSFSIIIVNCPCSVTNTTCNLTLFVIHCKNMGIIDLLCYSYCHLISGLSSKLQSFMTIFHHIFVRMQNMAKWMN